MSISIAQTRQQLSAVIDLAQSNPQIITKHNTPIAVMVSAEYFNRTESTVHRGLSFYDELVALRKTYEPQDDLGLPVSEQRNSPTSDWLRSNSFVKSPGSAKNRAK